MKHKNFQLTVQMPDRNGHYYDFVQVLFQSEAQAAIRFDQFARELLARYPHIETIKGLLEEKPTFRLVDSYEFNRYD